MRPWRYYFFLTLRMLCAVGLMLWVWHKVRQGNEGVSVSWQELKVGWLLVAVLCGGACVVGWACRWWYFLQVYGLNVRFREIARLTLFAEFFNLYFLGPLGADGMRLLALSKSFPNQKRAIVGSLFIDHTGGLFGGSLFFFLFTRVAQVFTESELHAATLAIGGLLFLTFMALNIIVAPGLQRFIQSLPVLRLTVIPLKPFYASGRKYGSLAAGYLMSVLSTGFAFSAYWAAARAVNADVSLAKMLGVMPVGDILSSIPITISGLGVRENVVIELLGRNDGIAAGDALVISLLGFAGLGVWGAMGGIGLLMSRKRSSATKKQTGAELPDGVQPTES